MKKIEKDNVTIPLNALCANKEKKLQELIKIEKKLQKIYLTYDNLLIAQGLWQAHYQI